MRRSSYEVVVFIYARCLGLAKFDAINSPIEMIIHRNLDQNIFAARLHQLHNLVLYILGNKLNKWIVN